MVLPNTGPISLDDIVEEFRPGYSGTSNIEEYYRGGTYVPSEITGRTEVQQINSSGSVSNTPNPGADRNQQYQLRINPGFSTSPLDVSQSGSQTIPFGFTSLTNEVIARSIAVTLAGSGGTDAGVFNLEDDDRSGVTAAQVTVSAVTTAGTPQVDFITASNASWTPRFSDRGYTAYAVGGGGSGGAHSTDRDREKVSSGGAAGGTAVRRYPAGTTAAITIGTGGTAVSASGDQGVSSGFSGGNTVFNPSSGTTITGGGGERGYGGRQNSAGTTVIGDGSTATTPFTGWGFASASRGGTGTGGEENYEGGGAPGFNIGGDGSAASGGGSPNFGLGGGGDGSVISAGGFAQGATTPAPTLPAAFPTDSSRTWQGGAGQQHSSGGPVTGRTGGLYGAGGGSGTTEGPLATSGAGAQGVVVIVYDDPVATASITSVHADWSGQVQLSTSGGASTSTLNQAINLFSDESWTLSANTLYNIQGTNTDDSLDISLNGVLLNSAGIGTIVARYLMAGAYAWTTSYTRTLTTFPTFSVNLDTGGTGVFANAVTGTFSANQDASQAANQVRSAILAEYPALTIGAVSGGTDSDAIFTIDTGQTGNLNATFACTAGDALNVMCNINSTFVVGNTNIPGSSYTVFDYEGREVHNFTHNPGPSVPNNIGFVLDSIETAVDANTETPVNFNAARSGNNLVFTATSEAAVSGLWSIIADHSATGTGNIAFGTATRTTVGRAPNANFNNTIPTDGTITFEDFYGTRRLTAAESN